LISATLEYETCLSPFFSFSFDHYKILGKIETGCTIMFAICATTCILAWLLMHALAQKFTMTSNLQFLQPTTKQPTTTAMKTKTTTQLLTLILTTTLALAAPAWAQAPAGSYSDIKARFTDKTAKPNQALFQQLSKATIDFLAANPADKQAPALVRDAFDYGTRIQRDAKLGLSWYLLVQYDLAVRQMAGDMSPESKAALLALDAAMAEGGMLIAYNNENMAKWRETLNKLLDAPGGTPFVLDREKGYYNYISRNPNTRRLVDAQLATLSKHKDKNISNWAKQETKLNAVRKTPFKLSVTTLDGKPFEFDPAKPKNTTFLYLYFWSLNNKNAADDLKKLAEVAYGFSSKRLLVLAVNTDGEDKRDELTAFLKKNKLRFPVLFDGKGAKGELYDKLAVAKTPMGYLFDSKGAMAPPGFNYNNLEKTIK